jgi:uncharacterized protein
VDLVVFLLLLVLTGVAAGLVGSLSGLGGGIVMLPVLLIFFGEPFPIAAGAGLLTILATSSTTGAAYVRDHLTDLRIGMLFEIATVPGALVGAATTVFLVHADLSQALLVALGIILLGILAASISRRGEELPVGVEPDRLSKRLGLDGQYYDPAIGRTIPYEAGNTREAFPVMFGAGLVAGMFGIGGGVFKVLALERYLRLPMKVATATSNFMIGVTAAAGAGVLFAAGFVSPLVAGPAALGTAFGAYGGSRLLPGLHNRTVRLVFLPVIGILAVETILRGVGLP